MQGYCGFYDTNNGRIYNDVKKDCTKFDKSPCPERFNSSDIFKCKFWYMISLNNVKLSFLWLIHVNFFYLNEQIEFIKVRFNYINSCYLCMHVVFNSSPEPKAQVSFPDQNYEIWNCTNFVIWIFVGPSSLDLLTKFKFTCLLKSILEHKRPQNHFVFRSPSNDIQIRLS